MDKDKILKKIAKHYLDSRDFNGIAISNLGKEFNKVKKVLADLVQGGDVVLNFGDIHPNPFILAFEPEEINNQLSKLDKLKYRKPEKIKSVGIDVKINVVTCCAYPSEKYLKNVVNEGEYNGRPYELRLALGRPSLSFVPFNLNVLEYYRKDPRYDYSTDDITGRFHTAGEKGIDRKDDVFLENFGFAYDKKLQNRYVAAFLIYLSRLSPEHQQRWALEEVKGDIFLHPDYARSTCGDFYEKEPITHAFLEEISVINKMAKAINGKLFFNREYTQYNKPKEFAFLLRPTKKEYLDFIQVLDKLISDNINRKFFEKDISLFEYKKDKNGSIIKVYKGSLALLKEWLLRVKFNDPKPRDEMLKTFKNIRKERNPSAHKIVNDKWDMKYFREQRELMQDAYSAIRTLRLILTNHPKCKKIEVPAWLFKGEIRTF